jgi:hypothetical protein
VRHHAPGSPKARSAQSITSSDPHPVTTSSGRTPAYAAIGALSSALYSAGYVETVSGPAARSAASAAGGAPQRLTVSLRSGGAGHRLGAAVLGA